MSSPRSSDPRPGQTGGNLPHRAVDPPVLLPAILLCGALGAWGGVTSWAGSADLLPLVFIGLILPAFSIVEGIRLPRPLICGLTCAGLGLVFVGASLPFYHAQDAFIGAAAVAAEGLVLGAAVAALAARRARRRQAALSDAVPGVMVQQTAPVAFPRRRLIWMGMVGVVVIVLIEVGVNVVSPWAQRYRAESDMRAALARLDRLAGQALEPTPYAPLQKTVTGGPAPSSWVGEWRGPGVNRPLVHTREITNEEGFLSARGDAAHDAACAAAIAFPAHQEDFDAALASLERGMRNAFPDRITRETDTAPCGAKANAAARDFSERLRRLAAE
jgi:hypothetical protein